MSQRNVDIVAGIFEAVNRRDFGAVMSAYADDIVLVLHGELEGLGGSGATGKKAVGAWFGDWFQTFAHDYRFEIHELRDWGDRVFIDATHHGRGRTSGATITQRGAWVYTLRDHRIVGCDVYADSNEALTVGVVRVTLEQWSEGDFAGPAPLFDPDIAFETFMPDSDENVVSHGTEALSAFTRDWLAQWGDSRIVADRIEAIDAQTVFASVRQTAAGRQSGVAVDSPGFSVWRLRDGKVVGLSLHHDRAEALRAAARR